MNPSRNPVLVSLTRSLRAVDNAPLDAAIQIANREARTVVALVDRVAAHRPEALDGIGALAARLRQRSVPLVVRADGDLGHLGRFQVARAVASATEVPRLDRDACVQALLVEHELAIVFGAGAIARAA
jgi:deoxyribodipyrimidine photolyase